MRRITGHAPAGLVTGVLDQLRVDDARARPSGSVGREYGDDRADPPAVGRLAQVAETLGGDLIRGVHLPPVPDPQRAPVQPADAPRTVPPGDPGGERQLFGSVPVGPVRRYLGEDLTHPDADGTRLRVLAMEQRDEALGLRQQLAMGRRRAVVIPRRCQPCPSPAPRTGGP